MSSSSNDPCTQWVELEDPEINSQTIERVLAPISDDLWVAAACVDRVVEEAEAQRSLLDLGISRTEQALKRAKSTVEHSLLSGEDEDDGETAGRDAEEQRELTVLTSYFQEETADARLCHLRSVLLLRLDRLNSFVEICKQTGSQTSQDTEDVAEEWEDDPWQDPADEPTQETSPVLSKELPVSLPSFLTDDLVDLACILTSAGCFAAAGLLFEKHGSYLWPYRFAILECIPDHISPSDFHDLLPGLDSTTEVERRPQCSPWRAEPDWSEKPEVTAVLAKLNIDIQLHEQDAVGEPRYEPLSSAELTKWYEARIERIISTTGMVNNALSLVQHAASQGVRDLDAVGEDLLLLSRLVYDAPTPDDGRAAEDWTLDKWKALDPPAALRAYLANSSPETVSRDITKLVMPFLFVLEARAEREGHPDPELPLRMLYDYILQAPLEMVAAIFEASKPTLPPAQRIIRNDEDMARLALACLYGSDSLDEWPTMSRIFECLPAWDIPTDEDESDEADTTILSLGAFVTPSTTRPVCGPADLLLFFKPLPPASLSRALDILDVHLEAGEILARWSVPAPLRWFLRSNSDAVEQRAWANRMARRAGGTHDKLESQEDWEWLLEDMLKLCGDDDSSRGAFCLLTRDEIIRIFFSGLLSSGRFNIAKTILHSSKAAHTLHPSTVEEICLAASQEFYDNASSGNYHFGDMKLAYDCLDVPPWSERIQLEKDFIEATSRLCTFNLTSKPGIPISPIEIRLTKDRLSLVSRVLACNPEAYKHAQVILELVHKLGFVNDVVAEVKTLAMLTDTALSAGDFDRAYENGEKMINTVLNLRASRAPDDPELQQAVDVCWVSCFQLGRHPEFEDADKKLLLLGRAMELCPAERLVDVLATWKREEPAYLEARRTRLAEHGPMSKRGVNGNGTRSVKRPEKKQATSSLAARLQGLHLPSSPLMHAPDAASLANKAFHNVTAAFPFSVGSRGRSMWSEEPERSRSGSRPRYDGAEVSAQATRVLQKGLGWLLGDDD